MNVCLVKTTLKLVRIVVEVDKIQVIDPDPNVVNPLWDLWVVGKKPLYELAWDQGNDSGYVHHIFGEDVWPIPFFQYLVRLGWNDHVYGSPLADNNMVEL